MWRLEHVTLRPFFISVFVLFCFSTRCANVKDQEGSSFMKFLKEQNVKMQCNAIKEFQS